MTLRLTPSQEVIVQKAVADGLATSPEDFISMAIEQMRDDLSFDLEQRLGMDVEEINQALDKDLGGDAQVWEGGNAFHAKMMEKHRKAPRDRS